MSSCSEQVELLTRLGDAQFALLLLTRCFAARPLFLLGSLQPTPAVQQAYRTHDLALEAVVWTLLQMATSDLVVAQQLHLPIAKGGVGLVALAQHAPVAYIETYAQVARQIHATFHGVAGAPLDHAFASIAEARLTFQRTLVYAKAMLPEAVQVQLLRPLVATDDHHL